MSNELLGVVAMGVLFFFLLFGSLLALDGRRRKGPFPWDWLDAGLVLLIMICIPNFAYCVFYAATGRSEDIFVPLMWFGTLGAVGAVAAVFLRATPRELGLTQWVTKMFGLGLALVLPFMFLAAGWTFLIESWLGPQPDQAIVDTLRSTNGGQEQAMGLFYAVLIAPLAEEIVFRGFLQGALMRIMPVPLAIVGSSVLFGASHFVDPITVVPLSLMGGCLGWLRWKSGSLWPAWAMHIGNNGLALGLEMML